MAIPPKVFAKIDLKETQRIVREEEQRIGAQDLSTFFTIKDPFGLEEGETLSLKEVKKLCPNYFVRGTIFQVSGQAK